MTDIAKNLEDIGRRMAAAANRCGRDAGEVRLLAVSKTLPAEAVIEALRAGQTLFGENKTQEAREKRPVVGEGAEWHMIGRLQKNKAKYIPGLFDMVHSVDTLSLAEALDSAMERYIEKNPSETGKRLDILVQVNIAKEKSKGGTAEAEATRLVEDISRLQNLKVCGLMIIPPYSENREESRIYFKKLRELRDSIAGRNIQGVEMRELSMGMSGDFEVAIEEGATLVRVGSSIFGKRRYR